MLAKKYRLTTKEVAKINSKGKRVRLDEMGIKYLANNLNYSRFAINIPQKVVKKSVTRNRIRRKLFGILSFWSTKGNYDMLIGLFREIPDENAQSLLKNLLGRIYV